MIDITGIKDPPAGKMLYRADRLSQKLTGEIPMKNKTAGILMEVGAEYNKKRLHGKKYFNELLDTLNYVPKSVVDLLKLNRSSCLVFKENQETLITLLENHPRIGDRVELLMSIPGVGVVTALTRILEIDDPHRFRSYKKAVSYCGLCGAMEQSGDTMRRNPLSKPRNKHLQTILIEAANLAPRWNTA